MHTILCVRIPQPARIFALFFISFCEQLHRRHAAALPVDLLARYIGPLLFLSEPHQRTLNSLSTLISSFGALASLERTVATVQEEHQTLLRYATLPRLVEKLLDEMYHGAWFNSLFLD
jgi:hypothetical protein